MANASDLSAKLLAQENIMVHRGAVRTASFDIKNRVLVLPNWRDMSKSVEDLMVGHEVGHALYTFSNIDGKPIHQLAQERNIPFGYINIIEDARIERMVKDTYPGIRRSFFQGYKELWDKGFFGVGADNVNTYSLIDRINLYFKVGVYAGVRFNEEEKALVKRIEKATTLEEVFELASEVLALAKKQFEEAKQKYNELDIESNEDEKDSEMDFGDDWEDSEEDDGDPDLERAGGTNYHKSEDKKPDNKEFRPEDTTRTQDVFDKKMSELAATDIEFCNVTLPTLTAEECDRFIVGYKTVLRRCRDFPAEECHRLTPDLIASSRKSFDDYLIQSNRVVNYLAKEFELKKSADLYRRARKSKTGQLDVSKLYNYKFAEDIFKRVTVLPQGKNHGMVMLVDWSGSMADQINDVVKQIISLVFFCKRVGIPFKVFAFTTEWDWRFEGTSDEYHQIQRTQYEIDVKYNANRKPDEVHIGREFNLMELFSNEMKVNEITEMARHLFLQTDMTGRSYYSSWVPGMTLGGTPLNEALVVSASYLRLFAQRYNVDRQSFVVISDGAGGPISSKYYIDQDGRKRGTSFRDHYGKTKYTLTNTLTAKGYDFNVEDTIEQTNCLISHINDLGVDTVGIFLGRKTVRGARVALEIFKYRTREERRNYQALEAQSMDLLKQMKDNDVAMIPGTAFGKMFLVPLTNIKAVDEIEVDSSMSAKSVATRFSKFMTRQRTSKVFLDKFVEEIA